MTVLNILIAIVGIVIATWFFFMWLPHRIHVMRIGRVHGYPAYKRRLIEQLFREGILTSVRYEGGSLDLNQEFCLIIEGEFGTYMRRGVDDNLRTDRRSALLPVRVALAFSGYLDSASDVMWLLWHRPFLKRLEHIQEKTLRIGGEMPSSLEIIPR